MKKHIFILSVLLTSVLTALHAQPPNNWTADMPSSKIPSGVSLNDIDTLDNPIVRRFAISVDATTYDNASKSTAFNAIGAATKTYVLNTWLAAQAIDTSEMSVLAVVIKNIDRKWDTFDHPDPIEQYIVAEDIYWITGVVKYLVE